MERTSLRSIPPTHTASLAFSHGNKYSDQTFCSLSDQSDYYVRSVPEMCDMTCVASYPRWLLLHSNSSSECCLFSPNLLTKINLPPLKYSEFLVGSLTTSNPSDPSCSVVFINKRDKSIISCRVGGTRWIKHEVKLSDKQIRESLKTACNAVGCKGKIYFSSDVDMVVLDVSHTMASMKFYKWKYMDKSLPGNECHTDFLVESCGEVFLVLAIHFRELSQIVRKCDVHRLNFSSMDWVRVETLGNRVFLLGQNSETSYSTASFSTTGSGAKGNCIYFTLPASPLLYLFDMDSGTVTTRLACPQKSPYWVGPFWLVPTCMMQVKKKMMNDMQKVEKPTKEEDGGSWENLLGEILELIFSRLVLGDCTRFHLTCKNWMQVMLPLRSDPPPLTSTDLPWLMSLPNLETDVCNFYHPICGDAYTMNIPELEGAYIHEAKYGWLLVSRGDTCMFFINPLTKKTISLPVLRDPHDFSGITFSCPPTSSKCLVLGHERSYGPSGRLLFYPVRDNKRKGDGAKWYLHKSKYKSEYEFIAADSNPIFCDKVFYILSKDGKLGLFNPFEDEDHLWQVLPVSPIFSYKTEDDFQTSVRSFLVECDGEILSVFVDFQSTPIWIYKLETSGKNMKWRRVKSLGDKVLFLSPARSALLPSRIRGIGNRIYFSQFHEKNNVYYSLTAHKYHCFECTHSGGRCRSFCEPTNCTWIHFPS